MTEHWIWLDTGKFPQFQTARVSAFAVEPPVTPALAVFRKRFRLEPGDATIARFSGDCKFRLYVNGRFVDDGPIEVGGDYGNRTAPNWWFATERDLMEWLRPGDNVIVAEVLTVGVAETDYSTGHGGFTFELGNGLYTDRSWKCAANPAFVGPGYWNDCLSPGNYTDIGFDDSGWSDAEELTSELTAKWRIRELNLPPLTDRPVFPEAVEIPFTDSAKLCSGADALLRDDDSFMEVRFDTPTVFFLRFPTELAAHLEWDVETPIAVNMLFEYQEQGGFGHHAERCIVGPGRRRIRSLRLNAFRYVQVKIETCGFFTATAPLRIYRIQAHTRAFPLPETVPFACSDPHLEQIRDCCDRTMRLCMQRLYLDSPVHQEGSGCTGDYMIEALVSRSLYGESRLTEADLKRTAWLLEQKSGAVFHTSYTLLFVRMLYDHLMFSGDFATAELCFNAVEIVLERFAGFLGRDGIVSEAPNYMFVDWVDLGGGESFHHPSAARGCGPLSAFYAQALEDGARLAQMLQRHSPAVLWHRRAEALREAFHRMLWDPEKACYCDGIPGLTKVPPGPWLPPDAPRRGYSAQTNILAVASGIAPDMEADRLLDRIMRDRIFASWQMYFGHYLFEAIVRRGRFNEYGFGLLARWSGPVAAHPEALKESWFGGDLSHAWSATPAWQIIRAILGVTPLEPGCRKIRIAPCPGPLTRICGAVPTPRGTVELKLTPHHAELNIPAAIEYELDFPPECEVRVKTIH